MYEQRVSKRNFIFMTVEGSLIFSALAFLDANTVIPIFVYAYTGNLQLAGLASTLKMFFTFLPQLLVGIYAYKIRNVPRFTALVMLFFRSLPLLMIPVLLAGLNPYLTVLIFLVLYCAFYTGEGIISIPWWDVFGRTIPFERRGRLLGYQLLFGGIGGLAAGFIIKITLDNTQLSSAVKYSVLFGCGGFIALLSAISMMSVRDFARKTDCKYETLIGRLRRLPGYLFKNKEFVNINIVQVISFFNGMLVPLLILFCKDTFNLGTSEVSTLIYVQIAGTLAGGILWGNISHYLGNKYAVMISQIIGFGINGMALAFIALKPLGVHFLLLWLIAFMSGLYMGSWLGFLNYIIDVTTEEDRTIYLVINSVITFPFALLYYFAGLAASRLGFLPVFTIASVFAIGAVIMSFTLKSPEQIEALKQVKVK
ncbi:MAG: MFS transporter [Ruminiclostridium sp.]|nr:MFS transporter [Ruminiclostridium sp.]